MGGEPKIAWSFAIDCAPPFLTVRFAEPQRTLGWTLLHPGFATVRDVVWVEAHDRDLTADVDPCAFLSRKLAEVGLPDALAFMTARDIRRHHLHGRRVEDVEAVCVTTVGLTNGERVGARRPRRAAIGTINTLVHVSRPLTEGAFVEAISIVAEARTAALLESRRGKDGLAISGTGTDCIVVASPCLAEPTACAGLHTAVGEAIGGATYQATREGVETWDKEFPLVTSE